MPDDTDKFSRLHGQIHLFDGSPLKRCAFAVNMCEVTYLDDRRQSNFLRMFFLLLQRLENRFGTAFGVKRFQRQIPTLAVEFVQQRGGLRHGKPALPQQLDL